MTAKAISLAVPFLNATLLLLLPLIVLLLNHRGRETGVHPDPHFRLRLSLTKPPTHTIGELKRTPLLSPVADRDPVARQRHPSLPARIEVRPWTGSRGFHGPLDVFMGKLFALLGFSQLNKTNNNKSRVLNGLNYCKLTATTYTILGRQAVRRAPSAVL